MKLKTVIELNRLDASASLRITVTTANQLQKNWDAFEALQDSLKAENIGRTALLHDGRLIAICNDSGDAYSIGVEKFGLGDFSIETFGEKPKSLGFFTAYINADEAMA